MAYHPGVGVDSLAVRAAPTLYKSKLLDTMLIILYSYNRSIKEKGVMVCQHMKLNYLKLLTDTAITSRLC